MLGYGARRAIRNAAIVLSLAASPSFAQKLTLVAFGDSLTQGYGLPQPDGFVPQMQNWLTANGADVTIIKCGRLRRYHRRRLGAYGLDANA